MPRTQPVLKREQKKLRLVSAGPPHTIQPPVTPLVATTYMDIPSQPGVVLAVL